MQLSSDWSRERWKEAFNRAGKRYTPQANVALPFETYLESAIQEPAFFDRFDRLIPELRSSQQRLAHISTTVVTVADMTKYLIPRESSAMR